MESGGIGHRHVSQGIERGTNGGFGGGRRDFVFVGLSAGEVCRFTSLQ